MSETAKSVRQVARIVWVAGHKEAAHLIHQAARLIEGQPRFEHDGPTPGEKAEFPENFE